MFMRGPVRLQGRKSEMEKFAGALFTTSVEGFVPATGKGVQVCQCLSSQLNGAASSNRMHMRFKAAARPVFNIFESAPVLTSSS